MIYEYQSLICALTGMDVANASMYDGATALAEAAFLACRATGRKKIAISAAVHPEHRKVLKTYTQSADLNLLEVPYDQKTGRSGKLPSDLSDAACYIISQPNFFGCIEEVASLADQVHKHEALFIVSVHPVSLGLLKPPSEYGADLVVGEGQSLGNPRNFGGPGLGSSRRKKNISARSRKDRREDSGYRREGRIYVDVAGEGTAYPAGTGHEQHLQQRSALRTRRLRLPVADGEARAEKSSGDLFKRSNDLKKKLGSPFSAPTFKEFVTTSKEGLPLKEFYPELKDYSLVRVTEMTKL